MKANQETKQGDAKGLPLRRSHANTPDASAVRLSHAHAPRLLPSAPQPHPYRAKARLRASTPPSHKPSFPRESPPPQYPPPVNVTSGARPGEVPPFSPHATGRKCPRLVVGARQCFPADAPLPSSVTAQRGSRGVQAGTPASLQGSGCAPAVWCTQGWGGTCLALSGRG